MSDGEVKMQTILRLAGEFHRAASALNGRRTTRSRQFRDAMLAVAQAIGLSKTIPVSVECFFR